MILNAKQARERTYKFYQSTDPKLGEITQIIANLADEGKFEYTTFDVSDLLFKNLRDLGYRVTLELDNKGWSIRW